MAYVSGNPRTKKELKEIVKRANNRELNRPSVFEPGVGSAPKFGEVTVEGPHFPAPHKWYARVRVVDGFVTEVIS